MAACCRYLLNVFKRPKQVQVDSVYYNPHLNSNNPVEASAATPKVPIIQTDTDENQNNAQAMVDTDPGVNPNLSKENKDTVRAQVIAMPGPGYFVPSAMCCPPQEIDLEIDGKIDIASIVSENSDASWVNTTMQGISKNNNLDPD